MELKEAVTHTILSCLLGQKFVLVELVKRTDEGKTLTREIKLVSIKEAMDYFQSWLKDEIIFEGIFYSETTKPRIQYRIK